MANEEESKRKLVEFLWVEINRAIINSVEVKSCIKILKDLELLDHIEDYNLVLDVKALIELIKKKDEKDDAIPSREDKDDASPETGSAKAEQKKQPAKGSSQKIDGKSLTENEVLFQKHLERNFDESLWLKKVGIRFLN
ncbi:MAG: hypothetical protein O3A78_13380 [Nitrospinae bacterium]|jgi:hypothetical protein|nr:hypothetical protein [Nitrospinota bacterium]MDA1110783.1 hypothetical protein [Nitrospinota bacterium]